MSINQHNRIIPLSNKLETVCSDYARIMLIMLGLCITPAHEKTRRGGRVGFDRMHQGGQSVLPSIPRPHSIPERSGASLHLLRKSGATRLGNVLELLWVYVVLPWSVLFQCAIRFRLSLPCSHPIFGFRYLRLIKGNMKFARKHLGNFLLCKPSSLTKFISFLFPWFWFFPPFPNFPRLGRPSSSGGASFVPGAALSWGVACGPGSGFEAAGRLGASAGGSA